MNISRKMRSMVDLYVYHMRNAGEYKWQLEWQNRLT
jgi:hypothetical protein